LEVDGARNHFQEQLVTKCPGLSQVRG
jgi:hypothetical protein